MTKTMSGKYIKLREKIDKTIYIAGTTISRERIFDGKKFVFVMRYTHKKAAEKRKHNLKNEGYNVRIIKIKGVYLLYRSVFIKN